MEKITYVLKTKSGSPWMAFDNLAGAKAVQAEREKKVGVKLRLIEQVITEREL